MKIIAEYYIDDEKMSDKEFEEQDVKTIEITEDMVIEFLEKKLNLPHSQSIDKGSFYLYGH